MNTAPKLRELILKHRRHVELSPGAGEDAQHYALAVIDNILIDVDALAPPSGDGVDRKPQRNPAFVGEWHAKAVALGYDGVADMLDSVERGEPPQHIAAVLGATPQSAQVDGDALMEGWHSAVNDAGEIFTNYDTANREAIRSRASRVVTWLKAHPPTPPPASQERGRLQVFHCREADDGEAGCAKWCGNRTYCPVRGEAEPSPPSSAAKCQKCGSNITFGAHDEPGSCAAEQAKPDDNMQLRARVAGELIAARDTEDGCNRIMALIATLDTYTAQTECVAAMYPAEQAKPTGDDAIREQYRDGTFTRYFGAHPSEQAQAGEDEQK